MPFGIQPIHIIIIVVVALIIFGPARLPELGRNLGKALNEFRRGTREMTESFRDEVTRPDDSAGAASISKPQPTAEGPFCTQCGAANPSGARFCNKCGAQLPA